MEPSATPVLAPDIPAAAPVAAASPVDQESGTIWLWIAALLLALGGAFWWRRRKQVQSLRDEVPVQEETPNTEETATLPAKVPEPETARTETARPKTARPKTARPKTARDVASVPQIDAPAASPAPPSQSDNKQVIPKGVVTSGTATASALGTVRAFSGLTGTPPPAAPVRPETSPVPSGLVTTRMPPPPSAGRPQLAMELEILGAEQTATHFLLHYRLWMINEGPGRADSAVLRLDVLPGGQDTQKQVDRFFLSEASNGQTVTIPAMGPSSRTPVEGEMRVPLDPTITFRMNDRQMIIPLVAADLDYRWSGGQERSQATFVLGRLGAAGQERLGPINIDLGPRIVRGIGSKPV